MDKKQLLELEKNAHLSFEEIRKTNPSLAKPLRERLEKRAHRATLAGLAEGSEKLRTIAGTLKFPTDGSPAKTLRMAISRDRKLAGDAALKKELAEFEKKA